MYAKAKRDNVPAHILKQLLERDRAEEQLFFRDSERLNYKTYEEMLEFRASRMAERLNDFLGLGKR